MKRQKRPIKIGDRVRVYGNVGDHPVLKGFQYFLYGSKGTVFYTNANGCVSVNLDGNKYVADVHAIQCRKLKTVRRKRK